MTSGVDKDLDRPPVQVQSVDRMAATGKLEPVVFKATPGQFSLGEDAIKLFRGPKTWASPKTEFLYQRAEMNELLLAAQGNHVLRM